MAILPGAPPGAADAGAPVRHRCLALFLAVLATLALVLPLAALAADSPGLTAHTADSGAPMAPEQAAVTFEKADLQFKVDPARRHLAGEAALTFRANRPVERLVVDLDRNYRVDRVEIDGSRMSDGRWRNPDGRMYVDLPQPLAAGARATLRIRYGGQPHVAKRAPWDGGFVWSKAPTGEPWIATAVQGEGCDLLWPCIDHPMGEPLEVVQHITVPEPLVAAGNGVLLGVDAHDGWRTYHWRTAHPDTYAVALNIGPYEVLEADYRSRYGNTIPLRYWYLRGRAEQAKKLFAEFPLMLDFFEEKIGPYPFAGEKMGVVETPHLGMEHQTINAYGNDYKKDEYGYDWLLQHEFAHEWFGNQLTNRDWSDMWLHEGFGTYMQPLYLQWLRGDMEYMAALMKQRAAVANKYPVVSDRPMTGKQVYSDEHGPGHDIYYKGSLVLHTLRDLIGDKDFFAATRELVYGTSDPEPGGLRPRYGSTRDFTEAVRRATGKNYDWFFDVYLRSVALPELLATREGDRLQLRWKTEGGKPFPMPVEVRVGDRLERLTMKDGTGSLRLPRGASYTLDPHSKLLRALPHIVEYQADKKAREEKEKAAKDKGAREKPGKEKNAKERGE
jgi:aminopeptidase N